MKQLFDGLSGSFRSNGFTDEQANTLAAILLGLQHDFIRSQCRMIAILALQTLNILGAIFVLLR